MAIVADRVIGDGSSFDGRLRKECRNEHWFVSLAHACCHRSVATEVERGAIEEGPGRHDTCRVRGATGREIGYSGTRTLNAIAGQHGVTSDEPRGTGAYSLRPLLQAHLGFRKVRIGNDLVAEDSFTLYNNADT